jgi:hypothetical protein
MIDSTLRYVWSRHKTREAAELSLEDDFATGDIVPAEAPHIEQVRDHHGHVKGYVVTLPCGWTP